MNKNNSLDLSFSTKTYKNNKIDQTLKDCSNLLSNNTQIYACDYSFITPKKGDFVYLDPPYHQSGEKFYTRLAFDEKEQIRLANFVKDLNSKGVRFMLSNSDTAFVRSLYQDFNIETVEVSYAMPQKREKKAETVVSNY